MKATAEKPIPRIGDKVKFAEEKQMYTVMACDERFIICTKPFNPLRTVLYSIVDLTLGVRGRNNCIFNMYDYAMQADIDKCLQDLRSGEVSVSRRNSIPVLFEKIINPSLKTA